MSRDFPPILGRLIPRLSSPFDHEVVATARAIERSLKSEGLDWHDLAAMASSPAQWNDEPPRTESDEARRMRGWLTAISREDWLNDWSVGFIASLLHRRSLDDLTARQLACSNRIIDKAFDRGVRPGREAA